jgi:hypothetical protein
MTATRAELVRSDTGEVVSTAVVPFDMATYLQDVKADRALAQQQGLMAAYDKAVASLIGENDVQKEGGRTFKKKSAWRKLARHFNISVACSLDSVRIERHDAGFTAYAVANAVAPWGQSWSDIGACASDEATGRRVITEADGVATAMTRASNRAVSNLIAMGEVSAEEIGQRNAYGPQDAPRGNGKVHAADVKMPFGKKYKGVPLKDIPVEELESAAAWCREKQKFLDLLPALDTVIAQCKGREPGEETFEDEDDLPFDA